MRFLHAGDDSFRASTFEKKSQTDGGRDSPRDRWKSLPLHWLSTYRRRGADGGAVNQAEGARHEALVKKQQKEGNERQ